MNSINRLEETWTPQWDLGLQDEFGFSDSENLIEETVLVGERPNPWSMASREVLNRQAPADGVGQVISFLEALSLEIASDE